MDRVSQTSRSQNMARVKGKNTLPELSVRRLLRGMGLGYRLHRSDLPGKPDIVLAKYRLAIFVHGCFWHRHRDCQRSTMPVHNREFWEGKFARTLERDARQHRLLVSLGWQVLIIWECQLKHPQVVQSEISLAVGRQSSGWREA